MVKVRHGRVLASLCCVGAALGAVAAPIASAAPSPAQRAAALVARMTPAEKLALVGSGHDGVPRLDVPPVAFIDGPNGVGSRTPGVTALPNAVTLGASFDPDLARRFGTVLGAEAAGTGHDVVAAPTVNILRTPLWGRAAETYGEDPALSGALVAGEVRGIQSQRVIAQVKHFAANNQELLRFGPSLGQPGVDVEVSQRALNEIYYPAFKAAIQQGGAASVMCSYNRLNGVPACQNAAHLAQLRAWGLQGFVEPDASLAVRDILAAARAGVENFQLGSQTGASKGTVGGTQAETDALTAAVGDGTLPMALIDHAATDILIGMDRVGLLDHPKLVTRALVSSAAHRREAAAISAEGTVLMKNARGVLPLDRRDRRVAVIGADAGKDTQIEENGSPAVQPSRVVTPIDGIMARAPRGTRVTYAPGTRGITPLDALPASVLGAGLTGTYFGGDDYSGAPVLTRTDATPGFAMGAIAPLQPIAGTTAHSVRWTGTLTPPKTGQYRFALSLSGRATLKLDGHAIVSGDTEWVGGSPIFAGAPTQTFQGLADLKAGRAVKLEVDYSVGTAVLGTSLRVGWALPDPALLARAVAAAKRADVAVVFANDQTGEGMDRTSLALPGDQDGLIAAVAKANPRTVVVLHTSGPVLMPWRSRVASIVEAWYPGQEGGHAIAQTLWGDVSPSGHLPQTWPANARQGPTGTGVAQYPGVGDVARYSEGVLVGYRWYDAKGQKPLFPFGFGLSYTSFRLGKMKVSHAGGGGAVTVSVPVRNTGRRAGAEVVQAYVGFPRGSGEPPRQLKGFARVELKAGRAKVVRIVLPRSAFQVYREATKAWATPKGRFTVSVGTSSRDLPRRASVTP